MIDIALRHDFGGFVLDAAFAAPAGVTVLFGPSGAGKSSVLLAVAGLLRTVGRVVVDGAVLQDGVAWVPPERRRMGVVFQDARLFPHLTVVGNLRYGMRRVPPGPIGFDAVTHLLGLEALLDRRVAGLSGGERQRVAIGRALLAQPRMLLMDEPLASLDAPRKAEILPYLAQMKAALGIPVLYVTHAMEEVARLGDHVVLIEAGRVVAAGGLAEMTGRADLSLALREDAGAVLAARVKAHLPARGLSLLALGGADLLVPMLAEPVDTAVRVRIPAREVILARGAAGETSVHNVLGGTVRALRVDGYAALVEIAIGADALLARVTRDAVERLELRPGAAVQAMVKSVSAEILSPSGNRPSAAARSG